MTLNSQAPLRRLVSFLSLFAALFALSAPALAERPSLVSWAEERVRSGLLRPLAQKDEKRSKFSRSMQPPAERRARIVHESLSRDSKNRGFLRFAVDVRYGDEWTESITGCVYEGSGTLYVAIGGEYHRAEYLLGKRAEPVAGVCVVPAS